MDGSIPITLSVSDRTEANFFGSPNGDSSVEGINKSQSLSVFPVLCEAIRLAKGNKQAISFTVTKMSLNDLNETKLEKL
jgi:hypothetical protein